ncbi:MAG TPA: Gfo/Idh/MocA family oxidoreductase [Ktedonobacteraceae bacterium]|nr:Gfo/Idh/MocA family oxidoreductase [Ktedonobacteraceae bacterium]
MKQVTIAVIGAGQRGTGYADYVSEHPHEARIVAVAEPNPARRERFRLRHNLSEESCFASWQELLDKPPLADAALVCTQDRQHFEPSMAALGTGYHVLLEKPMSPDPRECLKMGQRAEQVERIFSICHVLRYTSFFSTIKQLVTEGALGRLISIQHNENVAFWHYAHSFVRGNWRNLRESSPMILAKSCHDMDILHWLAGADCLNLSSFGSLTHFTAANAPSGAPNRCLDGCPAEASCQYYAPKIYLTGKTGWPISVISEDTSLPALVKVLEVGPYGRCVYHCDNDVVDHQVVNMEFANEVTAAFTMSAFTSDVGRSLKLMGTKAELRGIVDDQHNEIEIRDFTTGAIKHLDLTHMNNQGGHGGGDYGIMRNFIHLVQHFPASGNQSETAVGKSVQSHLMAFAAEESRLTRTTINLPEFTQRIQALANQGSSDG